MMPRRPSIELIGAAPSPVIVIVAETRARRRLAPAHGFSGNRFALPQHPGARPLRSSLLGLCPLHPFRMLGGPLSLKPFQVLIESLLAAALTSRVAAGLVPGSKNAPHQLHEGVARIAPGGLKRAPKEQLVEVFVGHGSSMGPLDLFGRSRHPRSAASPSTQSVETPRAESAKIRACRSDQFMHLRRTRRGGLLAPARFAGACAWKEFGHREQRSPVETTNWSPPTRREEEDSRRRQRCGPSGPGGREQASDCWRTGSAPTQWRC